MGVPKLRMDESMIVAELIRDHSEKLPDGRAVATVLWTKIAKLAQPRIPRVSVSASMVGTRAAAMEVLSLNALQREKARERRRRRAERQARRETVRSTDPWYRRVEELRREVRKGLVGRPTNEQWRELEFRVQTIEVFLRTNFPTDFEASRSELTRRAGSYVAPGNGAPGGRVSQVGAASG